VYGSLGSTGKFTEESPIEPNSPYSASKAAADMLVRAYFHTHRAPVLTIRSSNAYGPYQFPEKLIPLMISNAFEGSPLPVYGDGLNVRDWVHVEDLCAAILTVLESGRDGEVYNIGGDAESSNIEIVREIIRQTGASESLIRFVPDRPGHDRRYAMDHTKLTTELGWRPVRDLRSGLTETVRWYRENRSWVDAIRDGEYRRYYDMQYGNRLLAGSRSD
jgi:dTDP-glucose 4,6-dehydratase